MLLAGLSLLVAFAIAVVLGPSRQVDERCLLPRKMWRWQPLKVAADGNQAAVVVEQGVVKFYFASGKATTAAGAQQALATIVAGAAAGSKWW